MRRARVKCLLETRWQFFNGSTLRPDYAQAWNQLVTQITPYLGSVGGSTSSMSPTG
ncbi:hypothetical protein ACN28S_48180 [Cystobacter fuscus]